MGFFNLHHLHLYKLMLIEPDNQHGARGVTDNFFRRAAEQNVLNAGVPVRRYDDKVNGSFTGKLINLIKGFASTNDIISSNLLTDFSFNKLF